MKTLIQLGISASIFLIVFALGLCANLREKLYLVHRPGLLFRSLFSMNVVMPLVAVGLALLFDLPQAVKIGLIGLAISPVPPMLPRRQLAAGYTEEYVFGLLVAAVVFSIAFVPAALAVINAVFHESVHVPPGAVARVVFTTVLIPLALGVAIHHRWPGLAERAGRAISRFATVLLVAALVPVLVQIWPALKALMHASTIVAILSFCLVGLIAGHVLGGPENQNRGVLALATTSRHPAVAITIAHLGFPEQKQAVAAILLTLLIASLTATIYLAWSRAQRRGRRAARRGAARSEDAARARLRHVTPNP